MNAEETLAYFKALDVVEVKCESGRIYTVRLPDVTRFMAYGEIPLGTLREAVQAGHLGEDLDIPPEEMTAAMRAMYDLNDRMLTDAIIQVDHEDVEMTPESVRFIPPDDRRELVEYLNRDRTDPKASSPT